MESAKARLMDNPDALVAELVQELKAQGVFDQFRKDSISEVDAKVWITIYTSLGKFK